MRKFEKLNNLKVATFSEEGKMYMSLMGEYLPEGYRERNLVIPKINLSDIRIELDSNGYKSCYLLLQIKEGENGELYSFKEPEAKEMTIEEIEKQLGYKIKIKGV
jgi:hypothetical protein